MCQLHFAMYEIRSREMSDLVKNLAISQLGEICPKFFTAISLIFYYLSEIWRTSQNLNFNPHCVGAFCNRWDYLSTNTKSLLFNIPFRPSSNLILYIAILHCHSEVKEYFPGIESSRIIFSQFGSQEWFLINFCNFEALHQLHWNSWRLT